jgi:D-alanine-D-alanine ligase
MKLESRQKNGVKNVDTTHIPVVLLYNMDLSWLSDEKEEIQGMTRLLKNGLKTLGHPVQTICVEDGRLERVMNNIDPEQVIVFNWCEEIPDLPRSCAYVTDELERLGFTYTGANSQALRFSLNKPAIKERLDRLGIPTPVWKVVENDEISEWDCFPAIVKPTYEHSSVGITREAVVHTRQGLETQVRHVLTQYEQPVLVEDFIDGREFHVTIIGNGRLQVLPIAEMDFSVISKDKVCTYDSEFTPASRDYQEIQLRLPAALSRKEQENLEEVAIKAYQATDCRDYARLDIRQRAGTFYVLDINPNADISPDTSPILSAGVAGYSFEEFGSLLVQLAAHRHPVFTGWEVDFERQKRMNMDPLPVSMEVAMGEGL